MRGSSSWWLKHYGKPCLRTDHVLLEWYPGVVTIVHRGTEPIWQAMGAVMLAYGYAVPTSYTGSYACRGITRNRKKWSGHAWPVAIDINAKTNPYKRTLSLRRIRWGVDTDMPAAMVAEIESITASGIRALTWGGRWRSIKDAMHFQIRVTLVEIAGGVVSPRGFYEGGEVVLKNGDFGVAVGEYQKALIEWDSKALPEWGVDNDFGDETEEWVELFQTAMELSPVTGQIDGVTGPLLARYVPIGGSGGTHSHPATATVSEGTKVKVEIGDSQ